jgi:predicted AlkP superfamily phosphohydrolase/phosphomutase
MQKKVLLVGWEAADWKIINPLLDSGQLPNLDKLVSNGVMGNLASQQPLLPPLQWTSIATGKRPFKHGVHGYTEPDPHSGWIRPVGSASRHCQAIWNMLAPHFLLAHQQLARLYWRQHELGLSIKHRNLARDISRRRRQRQDVV